jgi:hypothetical protein
MALGVSPAHIFALQTPIANNHATCRCSYVDAIPLRSQRRAGETPALSSFIPAANEAFVRLEHEYANGIPIGQLLRWC